MQSSLASQSQQIPANTIYNLVLELTNPDKREAALLELR